MLIKCYICDKKIQTETHYKNNIFTSRTIESNIPFYKLLENFIGNKIIKQNIDNSLACDDCISKLNEYDIAYCVTQRIEYEFHELLNRKKSYEDNYNTIINLKNENKNDIEVTETEDSILRQLHIIKEESNLGNSNKNIVYLEQNFDAPSFEDGDTEGIEDTKLKQTYIEFNDIDNEIEIIEVSNNYNKSEKSIRKTKSKNLSNKKENKRDHEEKFCDQCENYFSSSRELIRHKKKEHNFKEKYVCDICGVSYKVQSALKVHIRMHNGENPFKCEICGKTFTQKVALKRHEPMHTGEKPYQCEKCGKQFIHYSSFHMHNLAHDDVRNKKCEICGLLLRSSSHLNRHMLVHTGQKPHACPKCGQRFAQRYNMTSHLRSYHQGIKRKKKHLCIKCDKCFSTDDKLIKHMEYCSNEIKIEIIEENQISEEYIENAENPKDEEETYNLVVVED